MIHNLVVVPHTELGYYELVAGERRYRALTLLAKGGRLPSLEINCLVISGDRAFENVVENLAREDVPLWEVGRTYLGFYESGFTQAEIGQNRKITGARFDCHDFGPQPRTGRRGSTLATGSERDPHSASAAYLHLGQRRRRA